MFQLGLLLLPQKMRKYFCDIVAHKLEQKLVTHSNQVREYIEVRGLKAKTLARVETFDP